MGKLQRWLNGWRSTQWTRLNERSLIARDWIRLNRWPLLFTCLAVATTSWFGWLWSRGVVVPETESGIDLEVLRTIQEENNRLQVELVALKQQLEITPPVPTSESPGTVAGARTTSSEQVHLNTADAAQLETLPGIGPSKASAIIEYRVSHGAFASKEDLKNVKGIGEKTYAQLEAYITVDP